MDGSRKKGMNVRLALSEKFLKFRARKKFASLEEPCFLLFFVQKKKKIAFSSLPQLQGTLGPNLKFKHGNDVSLSG